jgi:hypothetical protein
MLDDEFKDLKKNILKLELESLQNKNSQNKLQTKLLKLEVIKKKAEIRESKERALFFKSASKALDEKGLIFQLPPEPLPSNQVSY